MSSARVVQKPRPRRSVLTVLPLVAALCLCVGGGCAPTPTPYHRPLEPLADRLRATYPDLARGKFQVIADFETLDQGAIFRIAPPTAAAFVGITTERARPETGAAALKLRLTSADQSLVIEDTDQGQWTLLRDWRRFNLLLMSIYAARPTAGLIFSARSGRETRLEYQLPGIVLQEGWNLLRIDIGDMADRIDIADVREMRLGFGRLDSAVELYIDDIVLVDNAKPMHGSPTGQPGSLYCRVEGRRARVGVVEQFELVFSRGRIVQWFDLRNDPDRIRNLAGGDVGPVPVLLDMAGDGPPQIDESVGWSRLGATIEVSQGVAEASDVRVVVWGQWRFGVPEPGRTVPAGQAAHRWIYTVYATGKVYVQFTGVLQPDASDTRGVGYLVSCSEADGFQRHLPERAAPTSSAGDASPLSYVLYARPSETQSDLLFAFYRGATGPKARAAVQKEQARIGTLFYGASREPSTDWAGLFVFWPPNMDTLRQAEIYVSDYTRPLPIDIIAGRLVRTDPGDLDGDGFNESRGHYTLEPDGNVVKARLDGRKHPRVEPAFKIMDVATHNVWAYVDGLELRPVERDMDGNAIFQVPRLIDSDTLVEVVTREKAADTRPFGQQAVPVPLVP